MGSGSSPFSGWCCSFPPSSERGQLGKAFRSSPASGMECFKMSSVRLQKAIASTGILSRRKVEEAILAGRVRVNGQLVTELGTKVDPKVDRIELDGKPVVQLDRTRVVLFHKPRRVMTTRHDPEGRRTVMDYFPEDLKSIKPVGRLDYDSEGLLILTDDGEFANRLAHPRYGVRKWYLAWVERAPSPDRLRALEQGVSLEDGPGSFESAKQVRVEKGGAVLEVVVSEGRNRFVRRMLEAVGHPVIRLKRTRIGEFELGDLQPGRYRVLSSDEHQRLASQFD